jgi:NitT/TauT family transport system permease protein
MDDRSRPLPPLRPERELSPEVTDEIGDVARPLTVFERITNMVLVRRLAVIIVLAAAWEIYARILDNPLLFPSLSDTLAAFWYSAAHGVLIDRTLTSLRVLGMGYAIGLAAAALLTTLAVSTRVGTDFLSTLTAMFNPLPAIALLPLALIWFGLGAGSLIFVLVHSVMWAVSLNMLAGFRGVSTTARMVGRNYNLSGLRFVARILIPAAFPSILAGLKIGWAFAWRTLIAAELVFGVSSGQGGLGWYIFESKNQLDIPEVFAGLLTIILIGLAVENVVFRFIEARTVQRWGMQT